MERAVSAPAVEPEGEPRGGSTSSELRAPTAVPAAVESGYCGDGELRNGAAGAGCRERGSRVRRWVLLALALGLYARHWLSLAAAALVPARRTRSGAHLHHFGRTGGGCVIRWPGAGAGTSTRWRSRRPASRSRPRRGRMTIAISLGCASRLDGWRGGVGVGVGAAPCRSCASFARVASSGSSRPCWWSRSIG